MKLKCQKDQEQNKFDFCILQFSFFNGVQRQVVLIFHKLQIVLKELRETLYWLRLIKKSKLVSSATLEVLIQEAKELTNIIAKSIVTAKKK